jgi:hypothetical protein
MASNAQKAFATSTSTDHAAVTYYEQEKGRVQPNASWRTLYRRVSETLQRRSWMPICGTTTQVNSHGPGDT